MKMKNNKDSFYLSSTIPLRCTLTTSINSAKEKMSVYPYIRLLHNFKFPKYLIKTPNSEAFYTIELKNDLILFTTYSITSPLYSLKDSLLRLLSITAILSEDYSIQANSLFPYLSNILSKIDPPRSEPHNYDRGPELMLSRRIVYLLCTNTKLNSEIKSIKQDLLRITSDLILNKYCSDSNVRQIIQATGLEGSFINESLKSIQQKGNKLMYNKSGNFDIVRI